jgi:DNA-directed RNA polymerase subunit RPC12/RpoP
LNNIFKYCQICGWCLMVMETTERTNFNSRVKAVANHFNQRRVWIRCPRCIGGNMHHEDNGEYVCMQCGRSCYPDKGTQATIVSGIL